MLNKEPFMGLDKMCKNCLIKILFSMSNSLPLARNGCYQVWFQNFSVISSSGFQSGWFLFKKYDDHSSLG